MGSGLEIGLGNLNTIVRASPEPPCSPQGGRWRTRGGREGKGGKRGATEPVKEIIKNRASSGNAVGAFFQKSDRLAGEPLLPRVLVPQLDNQGEEARVRVVQVKPGERQWHIYKDAGVRQTTCGGTPRPPWQRWLWGRGGRW